MRAKVAVATVQGKAYFFVVNALKEQGIPFVSLIPDEAMPSEVKVVVTTENEKPLVNHDKILVFSGKEEDLGKLTTEIIRILRGKDVYEKIVVGIDPGEVFGLAVVADGKIIHRDNCFSVHDVVSEILDVLKNTSLASKSTVIKIGDGVPVYRQLLKELADVLPEGVVLEVVSEAGTNLPVSENRRSRRIRHISSAIRIAGRVGRVVPRRTEVGNGFI